MPNDTRRLENWLRGYMAYTQHQESPALFHLWTGLGVLGATTLRNISLDFDYFRVFTNMFVVLVAPPGKCRKTTCLNIGLDLLQELRPQPNLLSQKLTPEYLIGCLVEGGPMDPETGEKDLRSIGVIFADELGTLLTQDVRRAGMYQVLCALYDCHDPWSYGTRTHGKEVLRESGLAIMAGTTPRWIRNEMPADIVGEGFAARVMFVYKADTDRSAPTPVYGDTERELRANLIHDARIIQGLEGVYRLAPDATAAFAHIRAVQAAEANGFAEGMQEYAARREQHLLKMALLLAVSRGSEPLVTVTDIGTADQYLAETESGLERLYRLMHSSKDAGTLELIYRHVAKAPGSVIARSDLLRGLSYRMSARELDLHMETLTGAGRVRCRTTTAARGPGFRRTYEALDGARG